MDVAIVGAFGSVGRQLSMQLLQRQMLDRTCRLQLITNHGGASENEMFGMRSDLADAFIDDAPWIEVGTDPSSVDADVVVMLAGATVPRDVAARTDRAALAATNLSIFRQYADELARRGRDVTVLVQSNPVELGVSVFAEAVGRHRVLGAGSWNDTLRFRRELAREFGVRRPDVSASVLGEHGSHLVPIWSKVAVRGISRDRLEHSIDAMRGERPLTRLADEIETEKSRILGLVAAGDIPLAYEELEALPPDLRCAVKPFFIHFTSGRTTEVSTAHAVADLLHALLLGERKVVSAQVALEGEWDGINGVLGAHVVLDEWGWSGLVDMELAPDEHEALAASAAAIETATDEFLAHRPG